MRKLIFGVSSIHVNSQFSSGPVRAGERPGKAAARRQPPGLTHGVRNLFLSTATRLTRPSFHGNIDNLMWNTKRFGMLGLLGVVSLWAQNPSGGAAIENKFDTPQARVFIATLAPHTPVSSPTGHATNRVLIYLDAGRMTRKESNGAVQNIDFKHGDIRWRPASGAYVAENIGDRPIRILEIDLKSKSPAPMPVSKLDPVVVDTRHYKVELENEQVRIMRVHYDAHEKGTVHEHILNRVVVYLNDQTNGKAGEARISGAAKHTEENTSDQPADRIAVELK